MRQVGRVKRRGRGLVCPVRGGRGLVHWVGLVGRVGRGLVCRVGLVVYDVEVFIRVKFRVHEVGPEWCEWWTARGGVARERWGGW